MRGIGGHDWAFGRIDRGVVQELRSICVVYAWRCYKEERFRCYDHLETLFRGMSINGLNYSVILEGLLTVEVPGQ